jgi:hypothetical protein
MAANELEIGKIIDDRYQLVELLGARRSGTTYRAIKLSDRFASADIALNALQKRHRFRKQQEIKIGFPWKSAAAVSALLPISIPLKSKSTARIERCYSCSIFFR